MPEQKRCMSGRWPKLSWEEQNSAFYYDNRETVTRLIKAIEKKTSPESTSENNKQEIKKG